MPEKIGDWEIGVLGDLEIRLFENWEIGRLGTTETCAATSGGQTDIIEKTKRSIEEVSLKEILRNIFPLFIKIFT